MWIGLKRPVAWPLVPRISITSISTFGATLKIKFVLTKFTDVDELWERIIATFDAITNLPVQLESVKESAMLRVNGLVAANVQNF
jgi:hypothetical protein